MGCRSSLIFVAVWCLVAYVGINASMAQGHLPARAFWWFIPPMILISAFTAWVYSHYAHEEGMEEGIKIEKQSEFRRKYPPLSMEEQRKIRDAWATKDQES